MTNKSQWVNLTANSKVNTADTYRINPDNLELWEEGHRKSTHLLDECPELLTGVKFDRAIDNSYGYTKGARSGALSPKLVTLFQVLVEEGVEGFEDMFIDCGEGITRQLVDGCGLIPLTSESNNHLIVDAELQVVDDIFKNKRGEMVAMICGELKVKNNKNLFNVKRTKIKRWVAYNIKADKVSPKMFHCLDMLKDSIKDIDDWFYQEVTHEIDGYLASSVQYHEVVKDL